jgi:tetratricopeptide (TPR) repeat protein
VLSFALNYQLAGERPWLYHLTNLALHLGCVTWVYLLACELLAPERRVFAPLAAAWFGVTPHLAEAHVWISGRFDELGACFGLACCWLFLRALHAASPTRRSLLLGGAALSCLLSLLGKEAFAFALPALAFAPGLSSRGGRGGRTRRTWRMRALYLFPLAAALLVYAGLRGHALQGTGAATAVAREAVQTLLYWPLACWDGALSLLLPLHVYSRLLCEEYAALGAAVLAAAALGCGLLAALARRARRSLPVFAWSLVWFACTVLPVALIAARTWPGFGRFLYLPAAVFFVGMADLTAFVCQRWPRYAGLLRALLPLHVLFLAFGLYVYTGDFADDDRLFGSIIEQAPERSHGYGYLGMTYIERHDYARATLLLRKADALSPGNRRYLQALGQALLFGGHPDRALALADQAIARFASAPEFHLLAAYALLDTDQARAAREVAACLQTDAAHSQCREALRFLVTKHPAAAQFRERFAKLATQLGPKAAPLRAYLRSVL